ncbi:bidirectional sugar transporter N3 [Trifolium repens]|nr:bidirectional sugar transporter N3 [Trifolium repens]
MAMISMNDDTVHTLAIVFGILGNAISLMVYLAPLPTFIRIFKNKSTESFQSLPYLVALFSSMLWLYYALIKTNAIFLVSINSFGCVVEVIYCIMYIIYAPKDARKLTIKLFVLMNVVSFVLIFLIIQFAIHENHRVSFLGWVCTFISIAVFAAPLSIVVRVVKTRSVQFMPFNLSLFLTLSGVVWFAYGFFKNDICIYLPNVVGFVLGVIQMLLYGYYSKYGGVKDEKTEAAVVNIVVVNPLGTCEVFPIPLDENEDIIEEVINQQIQVQKLGVEEKQEKSGDQAIELQCVV